jgi:hypothetical protein
MLSGNPFFLSLRSQPPERIVRAVAVVRAFGSAARRMIGLAAQKRFHCGRAEEIPFECLSSCNFDERKSLYRDTEARNGANRTVTPEARWHHSGT